MKRQAEKRSILKAIKEENRIKIDLRTPEEKDKSAHREVFLGLDVDQLV